MNRFIYFLKEVKATGGDRYDLEDLFRETSTSLLIKAIMVINPSKDPWLSSRLHYTADMYDKRPTGEWDEYED